MADDFKSSSNRSNETEVAITYNDPFESVDSSATATNRFIAGLGLRMQHWIFIPYIIGSSETGSLRNYDEQIVQKKHDSFLYDNNGIYKYAGDVYVIWQSNSKKVVELPAGYYPESTATVTLNRNYIDTNKLLGLSEFDKLVPVIPSNEDPLEYASVNWEQIKHNPAGVDRTMFHILQIDFLVDSNGIEYHVNKDFAIEKGNIHWLPKGNRPGIDNLSSEGVVYSIRYRYVPSFYVKTAIHELRSSATIDPVTGEKKPIRGPMTAAVQLDWVFLQSLKDQEKNGDSARNAGTGGNTGAL